MALIKTKRGLQRQALQTIHNPPSATQQVKVSKDSQDEKRKMVSDLIPFLAMLYKKYLGAKIEEGNSYKFKFGKTKDGTVIMEEVNVR